MISTKFPPTLSHYFRIVRSLMQQAIPAMQMLPSIRRELVSCTRKNRTPAPHSDAVPCRCRINAMRKVVQRATLVWSIERLRIASIGDLIAPIRSYYRCLAAAEEDDSTCVAESTGRSEGGS